MFVKSSPKLTDEIKIQIDNKFILYFMPSAPSDFVKVYLYGLSLTSTNSELMTKDNSLERIAKILQFEEEHIIKAYEYWAGVGIINLDTAVYPPIVEYLPTIDTKSTVIKKFNVKKYADFNSHLAKILPNRNFLPQELNEYYQLMETLGTKPEAMLCIISFCIKLKGETISTNYILTVARNLAKEGITTAEAVENNLNEIKLYEKDISDILKALKSKKSVDHTDKDYYLKWSKSYKFNKDTIEAVAKKLKKSSMELLDARLTKYYKIGLLSLQSINDYDDKYDKMYTLAKEVCRILGVYYEQQGYNVDNYISPWLAMGFCENGIIFATELCRMNNKRTFEDVNQTIYKFWKEGRVSHKSLLEFSSQVKKADIFLTNILKIIGENRLPNTKDRDAYNTWINNWLIPTELVEHAATLSKVPGNPIAYLNGILAEWHSKGIKTLSEAKQFTKTIATKNKNIKYSKSNPAVIKNSYEEEELTDDDVKAIFDNLTYDDI